MAGRHGLESFILSANPRRLKTDYYHFVPHGYSVGTQLLASGTMRGVPFIVASAQTVTKIGAEVTVAGNAGSKVRLGIYNDDDTGIPGTLLIDAGVIAGDSATVQEITISQALTPGLYWFALVAQVVTTTAPTVRSAGAAPTVLLPHSSALPGAGAVALGWAATGVTGALPSPWPSPSASGASPRLFVKL